VKKNITIAGGPNIMKLLVSSLAIIFVFVLATSGYGQQQGMSFDFYGGGARSEGMGQAFLGVSDDGTAGTWNPAGLYIHEKTLMVFSYGLLRPQGSYTYRINDPAESVFKHTGNYRALDFWNLVTPVRIKGHHFVGNISYNRNFDVYYKFGENLFGSWTGDRPNAIFEKQGGINSINIGFGTRIYERLSFGLMGNIYIGRVVTDEKRYFQRDIYLYYPGGYALYESSVRVIDSTSFTGFNGTLGLMYTTDKLKTGLVMRTPFNLRGETDSTFFLISTENGIPIEYFEYNDIFPGFGMFMSDTVYIDNKTSRIQIPLMIGLGLSYNVKENWLFAADAEYKKFSGGKVKNLVVLGFTTSGETIERFTDTLNNPNWSDVWQFRLGTEYLFNTSVGEVPVRAGFRNEAYPEGNISNYDIVYDNVISGSHDSSKVFYNFDYDQEQVTGFSLSLGTGIHWSQILLDFGYTFTALEQNIYRSDTEPRQKSVNEWNNHHINFTFTGYF
jgi:hypothetical protein